MECTLFISRIMMIISESKQLYLEKVRCRLRKHHPFCLLLLGKLMPMRILSRFLNVKKTGGIYEAEISTMLIKGFLWRSQDVCTYQRRIQDFPEGGGTNSQSGCANLLFCNFFGRKLHENERIWT